MKWLNEVAGSAKLSVSLGGGTTFAGLLGAFFEVLPDVLSVIGVLIGIVLSSVVTWATYKKSKENTRQADIDYKLSKERLHKRRLHDLTPEEFTALITDSDHTNKIR